ncbi:MAG TPA: ABC transporter ATP-binding protein [Nitrospiria bacterium]|nr:ABC transporter ATP-binding protein [Nitrospiria bacterium]
MSSIAFDNVTKVYGGSRSPRVAVSGLSLTVPSGETFGFLGPNGAGKSTAIKVLLNLIFPTSGRALLLDTPVHDPIVRRRVGYLPENPTFYDYLTPEELLWFGGKASGMATTHIKERTAKLLDLVDLARVRRQRLRTFSKGMLQRAGVALALINDPEIIIFDEPMSGLDPLGRKLMADLIRGLKADGKTVFFSSHILRDIEDLCDRVGIIVGGRLRRVATLAELASAESGGWRVVLRGTGEPIRAHLAGLACTCSERAGLTEIQTPERDIVKLLDRLGGLQEAIVSAAPLRPTLEEILLREIERAGAEPS